MVLAARDFRNLGQIVLHDVRHRFIILVHGFAGLEVDIRVLCRAADDRRVRIQAALTECADGVPVHHLFVIFVIEDFDLLDFMGRAEPVKEVQERYPCLDGGHMGHAGQVHDFLHTARSEHGKTGLAGRHDILVVAENTQRARRQARADTLKTAGSSSPEILYILGIMSSKPWDAV
jgi:hypothetical protein